MRESITIQGLSLSVKKKSTDPRVNNLVQTHIYGKIREKKGSEKNE